MLKKGEPFSSMPIIPGMFIHMDPPEHTRYRGMLTAEFGTARMAELAPRIAEIAASQVDVLRSQGSPADLLPAYIRPVVLRVLSEVVGVPYEDSPVLAALADTANDDDVPLEDEFAAENGRSSSPAIWSSGPEFAGGRHPGAADGDRGTLRPRDHEHAAGGVRRRFRHL